MTTPYNVYIAYRNANPTKKPKSLPSEEKYRNRLSIDSLLNMDRLAGYFNTIYNNVDLDTYMSCGYDCFKGFNYSKFLNSKVLDKYKQDDKRFKRTIKTTKTRIAVSFNKIDLPLLNYCKKVDGTMKQILFDYVTGRIDTVIVVYCMHHRLISFNDIEEDYLYNIYNNYDAWVSLMFKYEDYIEELDRERRFPDNEETR